MSTVNVLIVEDDQNLRDAIVATLTLAKISNEATDSVESAIAALDRLAPQVIVSDIKLGGLSGLDFLTHCRKRFSDLPFILMTAYGNVPDAVQAMRDGAVDYLSKPFEPTVLLKKIKAHLVPESVLTQEPVAADPKSRDMLALAKQVAPTDATVMISGESGTGKEVLARYIHDHSKRADHDFIAINCAAIPENMLEATLFGYEKGAFTGAHTAMPGKFEQANQGTLLLDEISEMALGLQAKLLRLLQEREVERLGSRKTISLDVRVIATSNKIMREEVIEGNFREDLYFRLNVFPLHWIPLRERRLDILPLARYLIEKHVSERGEAVPTFSAAAEDVLTAYTWPGNAREMDNVIQRALILRKGDQIEPQDLHLEVIKPNPILANEQNLKTHEQEMIIHALQSKATRQAIATQLGMSPRTLRYKIAKLKEQGLIA